jgi:hypothetical protein
VHAEQRVARAQLLFDFERRKGVALQHLGHRFDQLRDRGEVVLAHAEEIGPADDAFVGLQIDKQQRRLGKLGHAGGKRPLHRRRHRPDLHGANAIRRCHQAPRKRGFRFSMKARRPSW